MQRKVNKIGPSTLMVSLPSKWAKRYNVKKGDVLEIEEKENQLLVHAAGNCNNQERKVKLNLDNLNTSVIWYYLTTAYRSGADEIELHFTKQSVRDDTTQQELALQPFLRLMVDGFIGMEILRNTLTFAAIKEISAIKQEEYDVVFRRIFFSILVTFDDIAQGISQYNKIALQHIFTNADIQVNKLVDYCIRMHAKTGIRPQAEYAVILHLEEIGDSLKHLARLLSFKPVDVSVKRSIEALRLLFSMTEKFYFSGNREALINFEAQKRNIRSVLRSFPKQSDPSILMVFTNMLNQSLSIIYSKLFMTHQQEAQ